jgi:thiosulfate/3-mercaptopyruvate sulfurtransferase
VKGHDEWGRRKAVRRVPWIVVVLAWLAPGALGAQAATPRLITTEKLAERLGDTLEVTGLVTRSPVTVLDVRQAWISYLQNHLPGAVWLNVETLRAQQRELPFQLLSGSQYSELFQRLGVFPDNPVFIYSAGDQSDIDATFVAWLLASAGATKVYVLDGGYAKWDVEARPLSQRYPRLPLPSSRLKAKAFRPEIASLEDVKAAVAGSGTLLVDARPPEQYNGAAGAQLRRGHIPGAINHSWKSDLVKPDLALVWQSADSLRAAYQAQGITPDRDIILYCNTGTEASHVFFALKYLLGYPRVRIFTGSWTQWAEREELPIQP